MKETQKSTLGNHVLNSIEDYFFNLDGSKTTNLYNLVLEEIEEPLFRSVMKYTNYNQCSAANILGISRGTLRKKIKQYNIN